MRRFCPQFILQISNHFRGNARQGNLLKRVIFYVSCQILIISISVYSLSKFWQPYSYGNQIQTLASVFTKRTQVQWNLYKWGNLEPFYSFPYTKLTSINGEVGNGGLTSQKPFCTHKITSISGVLCIFPPKNAKLWECVSLYYGCPISSRFTIYLEHKMSTKFKYIF